MSEITGVINIPFHGESAYEIAKKYGFEGTEEEWIEELQSVNRVTEKIHGYRWYADVDAVHGNDGKIYGKLSDCMTEDFVGCWFYVRKSNSEAGMTQYPETYTIDGANGYLSLRDYVVWTGVHLVHIPTFEAKASDVKNSDGKYSPKSGVDGLMSSTDKAYLGDLINSLWGKEKLDVFPNPDPKEGWQTNWLFNTGWYLGGIKKDCGGHPPVLNDNHTSWAVLVLNGMATDAESLNRNHRVQIAFDVVNSKIYMRRGWMSSNTWADSWSEVGNISGGDATSDVIIVTDADIQGSVAVVNVTTDIKEVVVQSSAQANIRLPENAYNYWRCILNLTDASVDCYFAGGDNDGMLTAGKTYLFVTENGFGNVYEVDNVTREIIS